MLWIAFIILIYLGLWQPPFLSLHRGLCCELLSSFWFTLVFDNDVQDLLLENAVVNCFHHFDLPWSLTTPPFDRPHANMLWIAFIILIYLGLWQQLYKQNVEHTGCELLSSFWFTLVFDNLELLVKNIRAVVNCFHHFDLPWSLTTCHGFTFQVIMLWIAFIILIYLGLWQQ